MGKLFYIPEDRQTPSGSQVVTLDDLEKFRVKLMMDIKMMLDGHLAKTPKRWLKSFEVREMLKISRRIFRSKLRNAPKQKCPGKAGDIHLIGGEGGKGTLFAPAFIFNMLDSAGWDSAPIFPPHDFVTVVRI